MRAYAPSFRAAHRIAAVLPPSPIYDGERQYATYQNDLLSQQRVMSFLVTSGFREAPQDRWVQSAGMIADTTRSEDSCHDDDIACAKL